MIKLQSASLREFQKQASQIQSNTLLPILGNLKIEVTDVCAVTKNSISAICIGQVIHEGETQKILVPERILFAALAVTQDEWITIDNGVIKFGSDTIQFTPEDVNVFPLSPTIPDQPPFVLAKEHIKAIGIAAEYINQGQNAGSFGFVHLAEESIFAFHPNYFYINNSFTGLPTTGFSKDEAAVICSKESIEFLDLQNHHVFFTPGYTYIFTKAEIATPKLTQVVDRLRLPGKSFTCNKGELVNFLNLANTVSESEIATCTMDRSGLFARLLMNDQNYGRGNERIMTVTGELDEFTFNSRLIITSMKSIPYETLNAKTNQNCLIIQAGEEWFCFIGMSK